MAAALVLVTAAFGVGFHGLAQAIATQTQSVDGYRNVHEKQLLTDFGWLARFRDANAQLPPAQPDDKRVVFMGDSITEGWHLDQSFSSKPYINRGISGQTTPQMLVRFRQDVLELKPKVVIILAGTNDVAGNTGPMTAEQTEGNIQSMAQPSPPPTASASCSAPFYPPATSTGRRAYKAPQKRFSPSIRGSKATPPARATRTSITTQP